MINLEFEFIQNHRLTLGYIFEKHLTKAITIQLFKQINLPDVLQVQRSKPKRKDRLNFERSNS